MQSKHYVALPLLGLAALVSVLPHAKAVTTLGRSPYRLATSFAPSAPVSAALPCGPQFSASETTADAFPVHLLDARQIPGAVNPTLLTESTWLNPNQVVNVQSGTENLAVFNLDTGKQTPLDPVNALYQHQEVYKNPFAIRTSPDGRWLLWPSGSDAKPTWAAVSLDGQERREWPRTTFLGQPDVAWMQDSRH